MKKLILVLIIFAIILSGAKTEQNFTLLDYFSGEYTAYTATDEEKTGINLGFCYINSKPTTDTLVGESMTIKNLELDSALRNLNAKVVKTEYLETGTTVIYAYSSLIKNKVEVFSESVNLQFALTGDVTVIGWPLILGSF